MTEEQQAEARALLGVSAVAPAKKGGAAAAPKKSAIPAARKAAVAAPLPEPDEDGAPSADAYRIKEEDIDHAVCVGRVLKGGEDKRWKPTVYREFQCGKAVEEDCDLCKICQARLEKFAEDPKSGGDWNGRVTEEPHGGVHMLGTEWAEARKPKWLGEGAAAAASDSGSEASAAPSSSAASAATSKKEAAAAAKAAKAAEKEAAKAAKEEEKAAKAAEKEAAKAAKEAEKAAAKAAKEAEKAAKAEAKEAAKAAKEAEKAAKASAKPAAKKAAAPAVKKAAGGAGAAPAAAAPAKASAAAAAAEVELELKIIDGTIYCVKGQNVYEYDEDSEEAGAFVGRLTADETIDKGAAEEGADEE
jgi:chemotaxis protein histidine kinase CheA